MSPLLLAWYGQSPTTRGLWWAAGAGLLLGGLQERFAADMWLQPDPARLAARAVLGLSLLLLAWLGPGLLWELGKHCRRWWVRLLSMVFACAGWCAALLFSLLGAPLGLVWWLISASS
ncbi:hypothetical protein LJ737_08125 [Hymenobacter sp. 15J16-1T3B]|uniref:hypothetical protein n=1 Tax=Hymenobacter sp. 15J16-1T3B TaxID=2886941 RepID=UPI001D111C4A|nr:hypothetical protein [Hymenobacter sp. 15J16-1T3B]MCC3157201.1 hypothetical protein [Hymenobacter sp. 15J16-1T3B]